MGVHHFRTVEVQVVKAAHFSEALANDGVDLVPRAIDVNKCEVDPAAVCVEAAVVMRTGEALVAIVLS